MSTTTKRKPTEEQKQAAQAKREAFAKLAKSIRELSDDQRMAIVAKVGAIISITGKPLSLFNSCLILSQFNASVVGGFNQWKEAGRVVRKGEKGIQIYFPTFGKSEEAADGAEASAEGEQQSKLFRIGYVFDVTQTDEIEAK